VLERRVLETDGIAGFSSAWRELTDRAARSPFETPAWLLPWLRSYGSAWLPFLVTWWRSGELVAAAPLAWRWRRIHGIAVRELELWGRTGSPLSGWVDAVVDPVERDEVVADLGRWLSGASVDWDIFNFLHLETDSPILAALAAHPGRWRIDLTQSLHSIEYVLRLPHDTEGWHGLLGPKARHEIRRQGRVFERFRDGRLETVTDPDAAAELVTSLGVLGSRRWGRHEAYFSVDRAYAPFLVDAIGSLFRTGIGWAVLARDREGIQACLVMAARPPKAVALMIGVTPGTEYRSMSLGKCLFHRAIDDAVARGCETFSFLTEGVYKQTFWHAQGQPTESGFVARGAGGAALAALVWSRRILPATVRSRLRGDRGDRFRP
jgi:CelD/BcsL family acetyltransferase involved in cellulose biosynthesis